MIVFLMSISLIGIIAVQLYWINNSIESKQAQFKNDVQIALIKVSGIIKEKEEDQMYREYESVIDKKELADAAQIKNYIFQKYDKLGNKNFSFGATVLEENFKIPGDFLDSDTLIYKRITVKKDYFQAKITGATGDFSGVKDENRFSFTQRASSQEKLQMSDVFKSSKRFEPIHKRTTVREISSILKQELSKKNINIDFKFGVYNNDGLATKLKSGYYKKTLEDLSYPLFIDDEGTSNYRLFVSFPTRNKHILSGISNILLLSLFFIFIIILAFSSSLYQLVRQKKISEIKTDFINNMTHEFKTPIATINLALDSIRNPKIINDNDKVLRYVGMIRQENKRMHAQVENVLRISRLEKNQIDISKEAVDAHDIIEDGISHVNLLVIDKKGSVTTHFEAIQTEVLGNQFHLTNVVVNILENALKYSSEAPKIDVYTESTNKFFILKIKDEGIGMAKSSQKYIFNKFYREQKGNIHDVKGHGLGLAYVKEIIDNHQGTVFVDSEKGKGSTFTVKLPLI